MKIFIKLLFVFLISFASVSAKADTINDIKERGYLRCGIGVGLKALNEFTVDGEFRGFYPELCRAVAAAVFGTHKAVEFVVLQTRDMITEAIKTKQADIFVGPLRWSLEQNADFDLFYTTQILYDTWRMLARKEDRGKSVRDIFNRGGTFCYVKGLPVDVTLADFLKVNLNEIKVKEVKKYALLFPKVIQEECDVAIHSTSILESLRRSTVGVDPEDYYVSDFNIAKVVISPVVSSKDISWRLAVTWILNAIIAGEEKNISREIINKIGLSKEEVNRILGIDENSPKMMGLDEYFAYYVLSQVGNYKELYDKYIINELGFERGNNALIKDGGLIFSPSF